MDDKILFYIVLGIIYFLFNRLKKKKPVEEQDFDPSQNPAPQNGPKPMSFEDLLKEITEAKQPQTPQPTVARRVEYEPNYQPEPAYVDYDDDLEDEEKSLEKVEIDPDRTNKVYEEAKRMAFNRPSLEETLKLKDVVTTAGKFVQFEKKEVGGLKIDFLKELRDPKGFKKAFIFSEVINRKHF